MSRQPGEAEYVQVSCFPCSEASDISLEVSLQRGSMLESMLALPSMIVLQDLCVEMRTCSKQDDVCSNDCRE